MICRKFFTSIDNKNNLVENCGVVSKTRSPGELSDQYWPMEPGQPITTFVPRKGTVNNSHDTLSKEYVEHASHQEAMAMASKPSLPQSNDKPTASLSPFSQNNDLDDKIKNF